MRKDFDDLYNSMSDAGRELGVVHGGVVQLGYQPLASARDFTLGAHPFAVKVPPKQATVQTAETVQDTQVHSSVPLIHYN